jgi:FSR family fosmidomycin resistance protein-like MFS transporter
VTGLSVAAFTAPLVLSLLIDTPILLWAARRSRAKMVALGLFGMGSSLVAAGFAPTLLTFALAFALFAPASGLACSLAQAALMDRAPERREQSMADWALAGTLGDLLAPFCIAGAVAFAGSHRAAYFIVGGGLMLLALPLARSELATSTEPPEAETAAGSLKAALSNRALVLWLAGVSLCGLLDEIFAAYGALWLRDRFPDDPNVVVKALTAGTVGALLGLVLLRRLLARHSPRLLLAIGCAGSLVTGALWLQSGTSWEATFFMGAVGTFVAFHYPLAQAQAYRAAGDRTDLVAALSPAVTSVELLSPLLLGLIADHFGLGVALLALFTQPAGLLAVLLVRASHTRREVAPRAKTRRLP